MRYIAHSYVCTMSGGRKIMFYENLTRLCKEKNVKLTPLTTKLGISAGAIKGWKNGSSPTGDTVMKFARYFNVSTDYLLKGTKTETNAEYRGIKVPVLGSIPAGIPLEAIEDIIDYEEIPPEWGRGGRSYFALKVSGDSMAPEYLNGDIVIFLAREDCESGDDCAVMINGEDATFKKVVKQLDGIVLQPINTSYVPKFYNNEDVKNLPIAVIGIAVESRRKRGRSSLRF